MTGAPLDRLRVAQLVVTRAGERHRGSGYRVRDGAVLTAAHVVDGAESVSVKFGPGLADEWTAEATSWWVDPVSDIAVVTIEPRSGDHVTPVRFGSIKDRAAVLSVVAVGFPLWKLRPEAEARPYRDSVQADGKVPVLSNWRERTLEVVVDEPPNSRDDELSPWQGMSGAALWAGDHVVGVIVKHHPDDGLGRLAAARLDLALDHVDPAHGTALSEVLAVHTPLPGVLRESGFEQIAGAYRAVAEENAPQHLHDRKREVDELVRFCAGDEPYSWWQAGPWAGKSALLGWFALHPPDGVDVVSFFIKGRHAGESDSDAFLEALVEQLTAMAGASSGAASSARRHMLHLLETVAAQRHAMGRTLLLVVDGLDEDTSNKNGLDRASIASLLPLRARAGLRVLVASRPHPGLPPDVDPAHPLRTVVPRQLTPSPYASDLKVAANEELLRLLGKPGLHLDLLGLITASGGGLTQRDLKELLGQSRYALATLFGSTVGRSVGASASRDQEERVYTFTHDTLRVQAEHWFEDDIAGYRAKLHAWADTYRERGWPQDTPVYQFRGYPGLLAACGEVDRLVVYALDRPRQDRMLELTGGDGLALSEIVSAARLLAQAPNPDLDQLLRVGIARSGLSGRNTDIPVGLPALWARLGHTDRAIALAESLAGNIRAEAKMKIVVELEARGERDRIPSLAADVESAVDLTTYRFGVPYGPLTSFLAALWGGEEDERARRIAAELESLALRTDGAPHRDELFGCLVRLAAQRGDHEQAFEHLASMSLEHGHDDLVEALSLEMDDDLALRYVLRFRQPYRTETLLWTLAHRARTEPDRALRLLELAEDPDESGIDPDDRLRALAVDALDAGDDDRALTYALAADEPDDLLTELFERLGGIGEWERATNIAGELTGLAMGLSAITWLALAHVESGEPARAAEFVGVAEEFAPELEEPKDHALVLAQLAGIVRRLGDQDRADRLYRAVDERVEQVGDAVVKADVVIAMAATAVMCGDGDRYAVLADAAEETIAALPPAYGAPLNLMGALADITVTAGDDVRARRVVEAESSLLDVLSLGSARFPFDRHLTGIAAAIAAPDLVPRLLVSDEQAVRLRSMLEAAIQAGDDERAEQIVDAVARRPEALEPAEELQVLIELGEDELALEIYASSPVASYYKGLYLASAAEMIAAGGDDDHALRLIAALTSSRDRSNVSDRIAESLVAAGQFDRVDRYVAEAGSDFRRFKLLRSLARIAGERGDVDRALGFLDQVMHQSDRAAGVVALAEGVAASGDVRWAAALCTRAEEGARSDAGVRITDQVRVRLANVLGSAADYDRAERLARSAFGATSSSRYVLCGLALSVLEGGDATRARALAAEAAEMERENDGHWSFTHLLDVTVRTGATEAAERITAEIGSAVAECRDEFEREQLLRIYVEALARVGRHAEAFAHLDEIEEDDRYDALAAVASHTPESPILDQVRARILAMADLYSQEPAEHSGREVADALAAIGEFARVLDLFDHDLEPSQRGEVISVLLKAPAEEFVSVQQRLARCETEAGRIADFFHRDSAFREISLARCDSGDQNGALRVTELISDSDLRDSVRREVRLKAIVTGQETGGARRYVAEVLASEAWMSALDAVAKVDLAALQRFADEVLG